MKLTDETILEHMDSLLTEYKDLRNTAKLSDASDQRDWSVQLCTRIAAAIRRFSSSDSQYCLSLDDVTKRHGAGTAHELLRVLPGFLSALRNDYAAGQMSSVQELIHADLLGDFLEMADHFLEQGFKDPAAVICGAALEEHIRKLCRRHEIDTIHDDHPRAVESMNADLAKNGAYSKLDQKSVTAWYGLRSNAAHGKFDEHEKAQVALMVQGVRDFISRKPA
jgi:hypothetical protein